MCKQVWDEIMSIRVEISKKKRKKSIKLRKSEVSWLKTLSIDKLAIKLHTKEIKLCDYIYIKFKNM